MKTLIFLLTLLFISKVNCCSYGNYPYPASSCNAANTPTIYVSDMLLFQVNSTLNQVTISKIGDPNYGIYVMNYNSANDTYFTFSASGNITFATDTPSLFQNEYNGTQVIFGNQNITTLNASGIAVYGLTIASAPVTSFAISISSWSVPCYFAIGIFEDSTLPKPLYSVPNGLSFEQYSSPQSLLSYQANIYPGIIITLLCSGCSPCDPACQICSGSVNNQCFTCSNGYYLQPNSSRTCLSTCPSYYYSNATINECLQCDRSCSACFGSSNSQCSACNPGYYLQPDMKTCLTSCPNGYYQNSTSLICLACYNSCSLCTGPSNSECQACNVGYFLQPSEATCLNTCPIEYYRDFKNLVCSHCDTSCSICAGPANNNCRTCSSGYFLQPSSSTCLLNCATHGYWADSTTNACSTCAFGCKICTGPDFNDCSACSSGFTLDPVTKRCMTSCLDGHYFNSPTSMCSPCDPSCLSCFGAGASSCQTCSSGNFFQPNSTTCSSSCPSGYWNDVNKGACSPCDERCATCTGVGSNSCANCNSGYYLHNNSTSCVLQCPNGYYRDNSTNTCSRCNSTCATCSGPYNSSCLSCNAGTYLQPSGSACLVACPTNYCPDQFNNICYQCDTSNNTWSIWTSLGYIFWLVVTLIIGNMLCSSYCILESLRQKRKNKTEVKLNSAYKLCVLWTVSHPLFSLYVYKDPLINKTFRTLIYFVRSMFLLDLAALIHQSTAIQVVNLTSSFKTFDYYQFLMPFLILMPLAAVLDKLLRISKRIQLAKPDTVSTKHYVLYLIKSHFVNFVVIALGVVGIVFAFELSFIYDNLNNQIVWQSNFIKLVLQDNLLSPLTSLLLNYLLSSWVIRKQQALKSVEEIAKKLIDENLVMVLVLLNGPSQRQSTEDPMVSEGMLQETEKQSKPNVQTEDGALETETYLNKKAKKEGVIEKNLRFVEEDPAATGRISLESQEDTRGIVLEIDSKSKEPKNNKKEKGRKLISEKITDKRKKIYELASQPQRDSLENN